MTLVIRPKRSSDRIGVLLVMLLGIVALLSQGGAAAAVSDVVTFPFSGVLAKGKEAQHTTALAVGDVTVTLGVTPSGAGQADVRLRAFDPAGVKVVDQRRKGDIVVTTSTRAGSYRWVVTAHTALSYRLSVVSTPASAPEPPASTSPVPVSAPSVAFYVDAVAGSDANDGRSAASAWRSLAKVSAARLPDGAAVLLKGGQRHSGTVTIDANDGGTPAAPVQLASYGTGRATITSGSGRALSIYNRAAVIVQDLVLVGDFSGSDGMVIYSDRPGVMHSNVTVERVEVRGYRGWGIALGSWAGAGGFQDVTFAGLDLHGNGNGGLLTYAQQPNVHRNVRVVHSRAYRNPGYPGASGHTGNGFVLGGVAGGEISHSSAFENGGANDVDSEGPAGIWTYHSDRIVIQHNESYNNRTGSKADGDGFDLDIGTTNSVLQYNYSHGNDGAGYLLWQRGPVASGGNIVRYNISENDARKNGYGAITVSGASPGTLVHHNTVFTTGGAAQSPAAVALFDAPSGYRFRNNLFVVRDGIPLVLASGGTTLPTVAFAGNAYHAGTGPFRLDWGRTRYTTLAAWRAGTGMERLGGADVGTSADPQVTGLGVGGTVGDPTLLHSLRAYRLAPGSPLLDAALPLPADELGARDFFGNRVPAGAAADVGAHELG